MRVIAPFQSELGREKNDDVHVLRDNKTAVVSAGPKDQ